MKKWMIPCDAQQKIKVVYGLKDCNPRWPTFVNNSLELECLDAPEFIPAGSTWRKEFPEVRGFMAAETLAVRDGNPTMANWPQGGEYFHGKGV